MLLIGKLDALRLRGTDKDLNYIVAGFEPTDLDQTNGLTDAS